MDFIPLRLVHEAGLLSSALIVEISDAASPQAV